MGYNNTCPEYFLNGKKLECVSEGKDLGVIVSDDLKWEQQCSQTVAKANKVLGLIKRNFIDRSKEAIIPLFKSLVRPHLEYCCQIWNPHYIKDIKLVEGVQRRATKIVWGMENLDYEERLNRLGLMRLDRSRVRSDLLETFKIINEYYDLTVATFFKFNDAGRREHSKNLFKRRSRLDIRKYVCKPNCGKMECFTRQLYDMYYIK